MKSIHHGKATANANLKGKLTYRLSCGCCTLFNWHYKELAKESQREIKFTTLTNSTRGNYEP